MSKNALSPLLLLTSPLGDDRLPVQQGTLHAIALAATEQLSAPFEIELVVVSTRRAVDPNELLYKPVAVTVRRKDGTDRVFHGIVRRMDAVGLEQRSRWQYRLEVVPRLWFLSQTVDCRIFQQKTTVQILRELFSEHRVEPVEFRIFGSSPVRPYTTQYNETDLAFAQRIMQETGYFYFFEHSASKHTLVVTDRNQAFKPMQRPLHRVIQLGDNVDIFDAWHESLATAHGHVKTQDYDPEKPKRPVSGEQATRLRTAGASDRQVYRWPAMTVDNKVAADRARFQIEAAEAVASLRGGHGYDPHLCPGFRFTLATDPCTGAKGVAHVIHSTRHTATDETWLGGTNPPEFDCAFSCFLQSTTWRDALSLPRPAMAGIFSGIVLGEPGEEIHADPLARIKVQPLFDHRKDTTAAKSVFIRVLHAWSGDKWGWQHLPRVGTEVGISFMNGDPDNPVVVGCFYHQEMPPVFPVPAEQTKQGFRSRSTPNGGTQDYNELSFDDKKGSEVVLLHAQKDHKVEVEHDQNATIGNDQTARVSNNRTVTTELNDRLTSNLGEISITANAGVVTITSAISIILRSAESTVTITPADVNIVTPVFSVEAGEVNIAAASYTVEAAAITMTAAEVTLATPLLLAPPPIPAA
jgi:type VI secretion system secreted protein VgrG